MKSKLAAEREARGWSKAELARRTKMAASDVGKIESGRIRPYPSQLAKLAQALGIAEVDAESLLDVCGT